MDDVGGFDAVQDHVHRADDVGQRFLFLGVEGRLLELATIGDREALFLLAVFAFAVGRVAEVVEGFDQKAA